jgi:predicted dehydrogenase
MFAHHPRTTLAGIWARRTDAASDLASANDTRPFATFAELIDNCDAVAFAVPPDVQAELAVTAARSGKALLLEKPIALDLAAARRLVDAVEDANVGSQIVLTWRYATPMRAFLDEVAASEPIGGRGHFISGALLGGPFATPWRLQHGPLLDLGPHVIDALDAALGAVVRVRAHGDPRRWVGLLLDHESGIASEASLSAYSRVEPHRSGIEVYTDGGVIEIDASSAVGADAITTIVDEFVETARGAAHPLDVHRGLHLQRVLHDAARDLSPDH